MDHQALDNLEIAPPEVVLQAAHDFAEALSETAQFKSFEQAAYDVYHDTAAEQAKDAFLAKQDALRALIQLNAVPDQDQSELERLRQAYFSLESVSRYQSAEAGIRALSQALSGQLSQHIGLDFAAVSGSGCCG